MNGSPATSVSVFVQHFDAALAAWAGEPPAVCIFSPTCGTALALEHSGDLYSCDHFVEPDYLLGNILDTPLIELVSSDAQRQFGLNKRETLPRGPSGVSGPLCVPRGMSQEPFYRDAYG